MTGGREPGESLRQFFTATPGLSCEHSLRTLCSKTHSVHYPISILLGEGSSSVQECLPSMHEAGVQSPAPT